MRQIFCMCMALMIAAPLPAQVLLNNLPSREFGQPKLLNPLNSSAPNLVEGREFNTPTSIAFDFSVTPPIVYIADTFNNRVLAWKNSSAASAGSSADLVIGQRDLSATLAGGPGTNFTNGLLYPVAVAVDSKGNLYVADGGNNRIVRYPSPFKQSGVPVTADIVIGQASVSSGVQANQGNGATPSNKSLALCCGPNGVPLTIGMAFDSVGNLWVTDPGNNRVLRFPLPLGANDPAADLVLGQFDFVTSTPPPTPPGTASQLNKNALILPGGLAFDASGRLYVSDALARVLEFQPPGNIIGQAADRVLGVAPGPPGQKPPAYPTASTLGQVNANGGIAGNPSGVFTLGNYLFVSDTSQNRVVRYDQYSSWPAESTNVPSPVQAAVIGQPDSLSGHQNRNLAQPNASGLSAPVAGAVNTATNEVWIADTGNNRILVFPQSGTLQFTSATRVLGQLDFAYGAPNLIEGREVFVSQSNFAGGAIVVDKNSNPPHLYIADSLNNRILGFRDARNVGADARTGAPKADLVIGQQNLLANLANYSPLNIQAGDSLTPNNTGLLRPVGLVVDAAGNLYVADSGNGRILRFPVPFSQAPGVVQIANLVLGQQNFSANSTDPDQRTLRAPYGLAQFNDGSLAVSDSLHNRILVFTKPPNGDFTNGQAASTVLGQKDFFSIASGNTTASLNFPHHIATDTSDFLYVCDSSNGRMLVFANASKTVPGNPAALSLPGLNLPLGVAVSSLTGEVWLSNTNGGQILRYPQYSTLQGNPAPTDTIPSNGPLALALDQFDNLIAAELTNRISFYFPQMFYRSVANFAAGTGGSPVNLTPGMLAELGRYGSDFSLTATSGYLPAPWPTSGVNDVEVTANGIPTPIFGLGASVAFIEVPNGLPDSGTADFVVFRPSSGQILASATFGMQQAAPGIFTAAANGLGQAAAQNVGADGSITLNNPGNAAKAGSVVTLWLTGAGIIPGLPADGLAPGAAISTPTLPQVFIGGLPAKVLYSGTSPDLPGLWQINAVVPATVAPSNTAGVVVVMSAYNYPSNWGGTSATGGPGADRQLTVANQLIPTIAVKQ